MFNKCLTISALSLLILLSSCKNKEEDNPTITLPTISINGVSKFEGDDVTVFDFKVRLSEPSSKEVRVDFETQENTAVDDDDFEPISGTLVFSPNEQDKTISVNIVADIYKEQDEEFDVRLSNPQNATLANATALGTIRNDDTFIDIPEDGYITPEEYGGWTKIWADEFDGPNINSNYWTHELGNHGWGNQELQNYTDSPDNSFISDGKLIIEAKEENSNGSNYSSARMITADKFEFAFGRVDVRAKLPEGQGIWPAIWMLGANFFDSGWPSCGEIDIMELVGHQPNIVHGTAHWGIDNDNHKYSGSSKVLGGGEKYSEKFHVFSIIWEPNLIRFLVDDDPYFTITPGSMQGQPYPFNQEFFFIVNIAVGGQWPGSPDASTQFPQQMIIDYMRVFQQ